MTPPDIYYTMPFVEGDTLRQILRKTRNKKNGEPLHPIGHSSLLLTRIFFRFAKRSPTPTRKESSIATLKPENIIVGKYGEVMILDWGIADFLDQIKDEGRRPGQSLDNPGAWI